MPEGIAKSATRQPDYHEACRAKADTLRSDFPELFSQCYSLTCPLGWYEIVWGLSYLMRVLDPTIRVAQVKPKMGSLRYYLDPEAGGRFTKTAYELIRCAESIACRTCEKCGSDGEPKGWFVLCEGCST